MKIEDMKLWFAMLGAEEVELPRWRRKMHADVLALQCSSRYLKEVVMYERGEKNESVP